MFQQQKRLLVLVISLAGACSHAATLNIGGNFRFGTNMYSNLDLAAGDNSLGGNTSTYVEYRALIKPEIVVDDRFVVKSEFSYLGMDPIAQGNDVPENMGTVLGKADKSSGAIYLRRSWLEWSSDWGIFRVGRQPKEWGLGILYSAGKDPLDDFGSTVDRVGFQALLGNLGVNLAYEKGAEGRLNYDADDIDTYELALDYSNPESNLDVGIMYTRNVRTIGAASLLKSSNDLSIFSQKKMGDLQLGAEFVTINQDINGSSSGLLAQIDYQKTGAKFGADIAWSTGDALASYNFNPNYQPMLILFHQTLGTTKPATQTRGGSTGAAFGSAMANGTGSGGLLLKGRFDYGFDQGKMNFGVDAGWAKLTYQGTNPGVGLGTEFDLSLTQKWYENFKLSYALGVLVPGDAFGPSQQSAWGAQIRGALTF